eukprot:scaffold57636_cov67-Phaeocystis_antarctica.AAC.1
MQSSGRPNAVDAQVETVKDIEQCSDGCWHRYLEDTLNARCNLCSIGAEGDQWVEEWSARVHRRRFSYLVESDHLFERRANLWQGLIGRVAQALARLRPAAPAEQE